MPNAPDPRPAETSSEVWPATASSKSCTMPAPLRARPVTSPRSIRSTSTGREPDLDDVRAQPPDDRPLELARAQDVGHEARAASARPGCAGARPGSARAPRPRDVGPREVGDADLALAAAQRIRAHAVEIQRLRARRAAASPTRRPAASPPRRSGRGRGRPCAWTSWMRGVVVRGHVDQVVRRVRAAAAAAAGHPDVSQAPLARLGQARPHHVGRAAGGADPDATSPGLP